MAAGHARTKLEREELRRQVVEAAAVEMLRVGPDKFKATTLVEQFADKGLARTTVFRWLAEARAGGQLGGAVTAKLHRRAARRRERAPDVALDAAKRAVKKLPAPLPMDTFVPQGGIAIIDHLRKCVDVAHEVMEHARGPDGKPRNLKMLLTSSEHLRRCMETAQRIHERIYEMQRIEEFHRQIIEAVRLESPACAQRILVHFDHLSQKFGAVA